MVTARALWDGLTQENKRALFALSDKVLTEFTIKMRGFLSWDSLTRGDKKLIKKVMIEQGLI